MIGFCPLASGSKGNSIYLGTENIKILIDAGISFKQIKKRLFEIGVDIEEISAILITHEHMDHISGLKMVCKNKKVDVFANAETAKGIYRNLDILPSFKIFTTGEEFELGDLKVKPFSVQHDTFDPVGFVIYVKGLKLGFCTDLGFVSTHVIKNLENCDYLYLEANHQPSMVWSSNRPIIYKQRVLGRQGHLSNEDAAKLLKSIFHAQLKHVHLAHLSQECNSVDLAKEIIKKAADREIPISIAWQDKVSNPVVF